MNYNDYSPTSLIELLSGSKENVCECVSNHMEIILNSEF